jgi:peptide/nickel transport system substrate-binding protein
VWLKVPSVTSYWAGRTAATQMLSVAFSSKAVWNESHYFNPKFDQALAAAKAELDDTKRKQLVWDCQAMLHEDGAALVPAFKNWIDAHSTKVGGHVPFELFDLDGGYIIENAWLKA